MNHILQAAAENVRLGWVLGVMTVFFLLWFIGWTVWAFAPRNKALMDEVARMPLSDGGDS
jgi:cbb3-type cytochrome oxidase subunit 3